MHKSDLIWLKLKVKLEGWWDEMICVYLSMWLLKKKRSEWFGFDWFGWMEVFEVWTEFEGVKDLFCRAVYYIALLFSSKNSWYTYAQKYFCWQGKVENEREMH